MPEFSKPINATLVDPAFIANVGKKLLLDRETGKIWGGGVNSFVAAQIGDQDHLWRL